ncbi:hypothetical protein Tco_0431812 [Tanacetum coccineum]
MHDNIVPKPDLALELGKSISLTEAEEEAVAREVHATHARIVSGPDPEPMQEDQTGSNSGKLHVSLAGPNPEHMDDESVTAYPKPRVIRIKNLKESKEIIRFKGNKLYSSMKMPWIRKLSQEEFSDSLRSLKGIQTLTLLNKRCLNNERPLRKAQIEKRTTWNWRLNMKELVHTRGSVRPQSSLEPQNDGTGIQARGFLMTEKLIL